MYLNDSKQWHCASTVYLFSLIANYDVTLFLSCEVVSVYNLSFHILSKVIIWNAITNLHYFELTRYDMLCFGSFIKEHSKSKKKNKKEAISFFFFFLNFINFILSLLSKLSENMITSGKIVWMVSKNCGILIYNIVQTWKTRYKKLKQI